MPAGFIVFLGVLVVAQLSLPRSYAFLPLIVAGAHLGNIETLPELTPARTLIVIGLARTISGGLRLRFCRLDAWFGAFAFFAVLSTVGHSADAYTSSPLSARLGMVLNVAGTYLYARAYLPDQAAFRRLATFVPLVLIPLAICMTLEKNTGRNLYYYLGSGGEFSAVREGKIRAQGPFQHPILAGCAGATAMPFAWWSWLRRRRLLAVCGGAACLAVVFGCSSSGPLAAVAVVVFAISFWRWRHYLRLFLWTIVGLAFLYGISKGRGPWFLMASIDLVGGSTGWHRAQLLDQGIGNLGEWWLFGTDYTRHWMATGVSWNPNMADITNYYLHLGVIGGLPLVVCIIGILVTAYRMISRRMHLLRVAQDGDEVEIWVVGSILTGHAVSFVSISYFDQMYIFFYMLLGLIPGLVDTAIDGLSAPTESLDAQTSERTSVRFYS
jgi:hypothetical protein